jgi:hypothetical protein
MTGNSDLRTINPVIWEGENPEKIKSTASINPLINRLGIVSRQHVLSIYDCQ